MIGIGVFLGASAEQWRETRHHHDVATASLRNFRREVADNRSTVAHVRTYHIALGSGTRDFLEADGAPTLTALFAATHWHGAVPAALKHTAWDPIPRPRHHSAWRSANTPNLSQVCADRRP